MKNCVEYVGLTFSLKTIIFSLVVNMFHGISSLSLDSKGRITIPVRYREQLVPSITGIIAIVESDFGCLVMMPHQVWASKAKNLMLDGTDRQKRFWIGLSDTPELDRAGRILITPILRTGASLNGEVVLLGVGEHLEVWDSHRLARHKDIVRQNNEQ